MIDFFSLLNLNDDTPSKGDEPPIDTENLIVLLEKIFKPIIIIATAIAAFVFCILLIRNCILVKHAKDPAQRHHIALGICWQIAAFIVCLAAPFVTWQLWKIGGGKGESPVQPEKLLGLKLACYSHLPTLTVNIPEFITLSMIL